MMESNKAVTRLAVGLSVLLLLAAGLVIAFGLLVAANGYSQRQATIAIAVSLVSMGFALAAGARLAARLTRRLAESGKASKLAAVLGGVITGSALGLVVMVVGSLVGMLIAEAF
jgi:hypothetical protein